MYLSLIYQSCFFDKVVARSARYQLYQEAIETWNYWWGIKPSMYLAIEG